MTNRTGVPQGSESSLLLFLIYVNNIAHVSMLFHYILFADDTSLVKTTIKIFHTTGLLLGRCNISLFYNRITKE